MIPDRKALEDAIARIEKAAGYWEANTKTYRALDTVLTAARAQLAVVGDGGRPQMMVCVNCGGLAARDQQLDMRAAACVKALDGLPQDALDGGWTAAGICAYAKKLETELAAARAQLDTEAKERCRCGTPDTNSIGRCSRCQKQVRSTKHIGLYDWLRTHSFVVGAGKISFGTGITQSQPEALDAAIAKAASYGHEPVVLRAQLAVAGDGGLADEFANMARSPTFFAEYGAKWMLDNKVRILAALRANSGATQGAGK